MKWEYDGKVYENAKDVLADIFDKLTKEDLVEAMTEGTWEEMWEDLIWDLEEAEEAGVSVPYMIRLGIRRLE